MSIVELSLCQLGGALQQAVDSENSLQPMVYGNSMTSVYDEIIVELKRRCESALNAKQLYKYHARDFEKLPSAEKFNELYAMMAVVQAYHNGS